MFWSYSAPNASAGRCLLAATLSGNSGVGVAGKLEYDVQLERLTIAIPPPGLALMTGTEVDFRPVGQGQFDLDNVVGTACCTLQRCDRYSSSSTHDTKSSRVTPRRWRISETPRPRS